MKGEFIFGIYLKPTSKDHTIYGTSFRPITHTITTYNSTTPTLVSIPLTDDAGMKAVLIIRHMTDTNCERVVDTPTAL